MLRYVVEQHHRLVSKAELLRAVWGATRVSDEGLRDYMCEIRHALHDDASAPRFVETVRGRGYRFIANIQEAEMKVASPAASDVQDLHSAPALLFPDTLSLVVLPFVNLSGDSAQDCFIDGLTEELTTALAGLPYVFVISRQSAFTYKGKAVKVQEVSRELGVRYVVSGSVRTSRDHVRISVHCLDGVTDGHVWADRYDYVRKEMFALQEEVVQRILLALHARFAVMPITLHNASFFPTLRKRARAEESRA